MSVSLTMPGNPAGPSKSKRKLIELFNPKKKHKRTQAASTTPVANDPVAGCAPEAPNPTTSSRYPPRRLVHQSGESSKHAPAPDSNAKTSRRKVGWRVVKEVLETISDGCDLFLPLKAALVGVVAVMDAVDKVQDAREGFEEICEKIKGLQKILAYYESVPDRSPLVERRITKITTHLEMIADAINGKSGRGLFKRTLEATGDLQDIETMFRKLATLIDEFQLDCALHKEQLTEDIRTTEILSLLHAIPDAGIDAQAGDECMEGTRVGILQALDTWKDDDGGSRIFWLDGMAGTGKSAIARSFCLSLRRAGMLGGSFFCVKGSSRGTAKHIIPTLAVSIARQVPAYRDALLNVLQENPDIYINADKHVTDLLERPLRIASESKLPRLVLVVDAPDECSNHKATECILRKLVARAPHIPIRLFISSRPEQVIRRHLRSQPSNIVSEFRLQSIKQPLVQGEIRLYIDQRLREIRIRQRRLDPPYEFPPDWPCEDDVAALTRHSGNLWICAYSAIHHIERDPVPRLERMVERITTGNHHWEALERIYQPILTRAVNPDELEDDEIGAVKRILAIILTSPEPVPLSAIQARVGISAHQVNTSLEHLHPIIDISLDADCVISPIHLSLRDYFHKHHQP
ncbi:hypothetical protein CERSUDRAFT_73859 [Gelatoporia subvermispora B]|uniref:NACHT domain-containing protein n=1 Tax=Ceriporiopsis subvermispora (strain B) TaxID=914234 RepID=M2QIF0_CERS8|nr:hypothetical protein CERSUDRAFT_73859 [Gelatoporia subvermispora B]